MELLPGKDKVEGRIQPAGLVFATCGIGGGLINSLQKLGVLIGYFEKVLGYNPKGTKKLSLSNPHSPVHSCVLSPRNTHSHVGLAANWGPQWTMQAPKN